MKRYINIEFIQSNVYAEIMERNSVIDCEKIDDGYEKVFAGTTLCMDKSKQQKTLKGGKF